MSKSKMANGFSHGQNGDFIPLDSANNRPAKKLKIFDNDSGSESEDGGVSLKVNEEYARRFEYNKKREEKQRLEDKYGKSTAINGDDGSETDSEDGVSEDDAGEFATEALDDEIAATLNAIRSKDPRVYDKSATFYRAIDDAEADVPVKDKKEKAVTLRDYHTKNLLEGKFSVEDDEEVQPKPYNQEVAEAKQQLLNQTQAADSDDSEEDDFMIAKPKPEKSNKSKVKITEKDVEEADNDPDNFLSNFLAARAWVPTGDTKWKPLESDNESDEERADAYEDEYNMYFEDPNDQNSSLMTYARDAVASTTVRREESNSRKKAREAARRKREAEKNQKEQDLARLRKLKVDEMEEKVKQIRKIGGLTGRDFNVSEWADVLEGDWSDEQWDAEMRKRFGESYYQEEDAGEDFGSEDEGASKKKSKKPKKPKFSDDIDIKDLIPDFDDEEETSNIPFTLSSDEEDAVPNAEEDEDEDEEISRQKSSKSSKQRKQERAEAKSAARRDRRLIENLVDDSLQYEKSLAAKAKAPTRFHYRETSPTTFGLTPRDILLASDSQLNEFAGLKKLASFRDETKKRKDKKYLSKKARLRQWRLDTFGNPDGPKGGFESLAGDEAEAGPAGKQTMDVDDNDGLDIREGSGKRKKKRSKKRKVGALES